MKKRVISILLCIWFGIGGLGATTNIFAKSENKKPLEIWLIAGQSNAVGSSRIGVYRQQLVNDDSRNESGYENVLYYGITDTNAKDESSPKIGQVKMGLGYSSEMIGPELGMAYSFADSDRYKDNQVALVKCAAGGTFLYDDVTLSQSLLYGNWASPTMLQDIPPKSNALSGALYNRLLDTVKNAYHYYEEEGYSPIIKGLIWSQGEADAGNTASTLVYGQNLKLFFEDLRYDLFALTQDMRVKEMVVHIGKIASTFGVAGGTPLIRSVREQQQTYAEETDFTEYIETDKFIIVDNDGTIKGTDSYHYNAIDAYQIGKDYGKQCLSCVSKEQDNNDTEKEKLSKQGCGSVLKLSWKISGITALFLGVIVIVLNKNKGCMKK